MNHFTDCRLLTETCLIFTLPLRAPLDLRKAFKRRKSISGIVPSLLKAPKSTGACTSIWPWITGHTTIPVSVGQDGPFTESSLIGFSNWGIAAGSNKKWNPTWCESPASYVDAYWHVASLTATTDEPCTHSSLSTLATPRHRRFSAHGELISTRNISLKHLSEAKPTTKCSAICSRSKSFINTRSLDKRKPDPVFRKRCAPYG
jgi:hypothetical protein